ncbi:MAG: VWA domain-containing protein [Betaproteobacteria bacterium]
MSNRLLRFQSVFAPVLLAVAIAGCGKATPPAPATPPKTAVPVVDSSLSILATTDLRDIEMIIPKIRAATGIEVSFKFGGTFESTETVLNGKAGTDAAWFANAKYLLSDANGLSKVKLQEKIMLSPLVIGVSESSAKQLKWDGAEKVTWADVMKAAKTGKLRYAMSNPASSNQGFMAVMGVAAAAAGKSEALTAADINRDAVRDFLTGYKLVGDNSTYLSQKFKERQGDDINAFINYESWLLSMNAKGDLREKLTLVYPHEGVATADYPLMLLNDQKREAYQKVVAYLKSEPAQLWFAEQTLRRPINPDVAKKVAHLFPKDRLLVELTFSTDRAVADSLIEAYLNEYRTPIASTFVLDVSGSMKKEGRLGQLTKSIQYLAGADNSITGRFSRLNSRERVWLMPFSSDVGVASAFVIPDAKDASAKEAVFAEIREYAGKLRAEGGTALYDAIFEAVRNMGEEQAKSNAKTKAFAYSVVVFTDGERTEGMKLSAFMQRYDGLDASAKKIPVFLILFAEGEARALNEIAKATGGKVFDARKQPLASVFKEIRAYQ